MPTPKTAVKALCQLKLFEILIDALLLEVLRQKKRRCPVELRRNTAALLVVLPWTAIKSECPKLSAQVIRYKSRASFLRSDKNAVKRLSGGVFWSQRAFSRVRPEVENDSAGCKRSACCLMVVRAAISDR
jgi:hypothetical protein